MKLQASIWGQGPADERARVVDEGVRDIVALGADELVRHRSLRVGDILEGGQAGLAAVGVLANALQRDHLVRYAFACPLDGGGATEIVEGYDGHWYLDDNDDEWLYYTTIGDNPEDTARKVWYPNNGKGIQTHRIRLRDNLDEFVFDWKCSAGPSRDGTHLGAAYSTMIIFELASGAAHVVNGNNQGCNGSMSPDDNYYIMHLELPHTFFCYRDKDDNRVWFVENPAGTIEWQNPEFSTHPDFATATAKEASVESGGRYSVWAVKISTKETVKLLDVLDGSNWAEPHLWVEDSGHIECTEGRVRDCGSDVGICEFGSQECVGQQWTDCSGGVPAGQEECQDSLDNDCDGLTDAEDVEDCGDGEDGGSEPDTNPDADADADAGTVADESPPADEGGDDPPGDCECGGSRPFAPALVLLIAFALLRRRK